MANGSNGGLSPLKLIIEAGKLGGAALAAVSTILVMQWQNPQPAYVTSSEVSSMINSNVSPYVQREGISEMIRRESPYNQDQRLLVQMAEDLSEIRDDIKRMADAQSSAAVSRAEIRGELSSLEAVVNNMSARMERLETQR